MVQNMSTQIKPPAFAGSFYPADPIQLRQAIQGHLERAVKTTLKPKAIIAPHAAYRYSGDIAGSAYAPLSRMRKTIQRIILLGPAHRVPVRHFALPSQNFFETPLGQIPIATWQSLFKK